MTTSTAIPARSLTRVVLRWLATFPGFPLGGLAALLLVGPIDNPAAALSGGLISGAILGLAQAWGIGCDRRAAIEWATATSIGFGAGLAVGAGLVGYDTDLRDLILQGAVTGLAVGLAQATLLIRPLGRVAATWPAYLAVTWALGWTLTTAVGVQVDDQFTVFGAAGAITVTAITSVLPFALIRRSR